jgi:asparagine synthetase B (glutamine-hydrolysing)
MCGIFGFVGISPDAALLQEMAKAAGRRGPHGCGVASWKATNDVPLIDRRFGRLDANLSILDAFQNAVYGIGHARLATSGSTNDLAGYHPLVSGRDALVHNGNYYNHERLGQEHGLVPKSATDSEVLLLLSGLYGPARALALADPPSPFAVLGVIGGQFHAGRRDLPLFMHGNRSVLYFSSVEIGEHWHMTNPDTLAGYALDGQPCITHFLGERRGRTRYW